MFNVIIQCTLQQFFQAEANFKRIPGMLYCIIHTKPYSLFDYM